MTIFRRTNSKPMMTLLTIWWTISLHFREENMITHFADRNTRATFLETTTKINGLNPGTKLNNCLHMTKNIPTVPSRASININDYNNRHFQKPNAAEYTTPDMNGQVTLQYGSIRIASGRKLMDTQNKPNERVQEKYNHRGEDTEEVVKNVNAEYVLPKKAKPPDRDNPESKLRRRAGKNVLSDNRVWFKQVLVEAIKQTNNEQERWYMTTTPLHLREPLLPPRKSA